jgi:hypothetical protein
MKRQPRQLVLVVVLVLLILTMPILGMLSARLTQIQINVAKPLPISNKPSN